MRLLKEKAQSGVEVRVLGDEKHGSKLPPAIESRATPRFKLHAKCTIIDGTRAVIGSMNMRTNSFDQRREVCVLVDDTAVIRQLNNVFASDWEPRAPRPASARTVIGAPIPALLRQPEADVESSVVLISRTSALVRYSLCPGNTSVGRSDDNDIVVADPLVSRHHAKITLDEGGCTLSDLDSANGTFVNGGRVQGKTALSPGDVIDIGGAEEFRLVEL